MTICAKFAGRAVATCTRGAGCYCAADAKINELFRRKDALTAAGKAGTLEYMQLLYDLRDATRGRIGV